MQKIYTYFMIFLMVCSGLTGNAQRSDREWTILQSWDIPGKASGLAYDGTYLYFGIYGSNGDHFYRFDPANGNITQQFVSTTIDDCYGMTWDGTSLWIINQPSSSNDPAEATELSLSGAILSSFALPDHYMSGIAWDAGDFWAGTYYPDPGTTYLVDDNGVVQSQFTPPADQIWDICLQGTDLWMADYNGDMLYKTDASGNVLESHACENIKPSGVVFDGTYLWYVDGQLSSPSKLYKVDLSGSGTPEITIPVDEHDYGIVTVNTSETWNMSVQNTGVAALEITQVSIPSGAPVSTTFSFPYTLAPSNSVTIPLVYHPVTTGHLNTTIQVISTDPINPSVPVLLTGDAVNSGPWLQIPVTTHNYGLVRDNAFTRWYMEMQNIGDANLVISSITTNDPSFILDESLSLPITIAPLDTVMVGVWFHPTAAVQYGGKLEITSNDVAHSPAFVNVNGEGDDREWPMGEALWHYQITTGFDQSPKAICSLPDITGDQVDEVVVCSEDYLIRCFNGNSSGIADVLWTYEVYSGNVYSQSAIMAMEDINADGYADIAIGTTGGDRSIRALSGKTGQSLWQHSTNEFGAGGWVYAVDVSYDYNGDGVKDVLAATGDDYEGIGPKRVYCLDGLTGVPIWRCYVGGPVFAVKGIADFTGDGQPDVIAGASNDPETQGLILGISGNGGSTMWTRTATGTSVWALMVLGDITGDDIPDVAAGDFAGYYYYIDPATNTQITQGSINGALILRFDDAGDLNNDGYNDVLVAHSNASGIVLNGQDGTNLWFQSLMDKSWNVAPVSDITGDGVNDILIGTLYSNNYCYFMNGTDGATLHSQNYYTPVDALRGIPDIVGDNTMEMVVGGRDGKVYCYSGGTALITSVADEEAMATGPAPICYPNPFSSEVQADIRLEKTCKVSWVIYDIQGRVVAKVMDGILPQGSHTLHWTPARDTQSAGSGYFISEITMNGKSWHGKLIRY